MARDDLEDQAEHAVVKNGDGHVVGVGRVHLLSPDVAQIRFMGVEEGYRERGVGRALIEFLEVSARGLGAKTLVLNARSTVVGFYEKLGFRVVGEGPVFFQSVHHLKMEKALD
ncbi:MAG: GNAT family N-acetyltransferase [Planctomycetales bacterium]|nr:GNAT family N-acetyltransferase [Planctomycetales bacterium]